MTASCLTCTFKASFKSLFCNVISKKHCFLVCCHIKMNPACSSVPVFYCCVWFMITYQKYFLLYVQYKVNIMHWFCSCVGERIPFDGRILFPSLLGESVICQNGYVLGFKVTYTEINVIIVGTDSMMFTVSTLVTLMSYRWAGGTEFHHARSGGAASIQSTIWSVWPEQTQGLLTQEPGRWRFSLRYFQHTDIS